MKVYLSGPMTGLPDLNFPAFHAAAQVLRAAGHAVVNPAEINPDHAKPWAQCMREDIKALCDCDTLVLMPGWQQSKGAHVELNLAHRLELQIFTLAELTGSQPACEFSAPALTIDRLREAQKPKDAVLADAVAAMERHIKDYAADGRTFIFLNEFMDVTTVERNKAILDAARVIGKRPGFRFDDSYGGEAGRYRNNGFLYGWRLSWEV